MSRMSWLSRFLPPSARPSGLHRSSVNGIAGPPPAPAHEKEIDQDRPFQPPFNRNFALPTTIPTAFQPASQGVCTNPLSPAVGSRLSGLGGPTAAPLPNATEKVMTSIVHLTIEINPIPSGKLGIRKRPEGGILTCDRCRRVEANAERDENGWELWYVLQRYTDLCPSCVPIARSICGESRRIPNPQFLSRTRAIPRTHG